MENENKLIAEFMKFKPCIVRNNNGKTFDYNLPKKFSLIKEEETTIEGEWCDVLIEQDYCFIKDLKFHYSWDWLMPVIMKCQEVRNTYIKSSRENEIFSLYEDIQRELHNLNIHFTYNTFHKWYNEVKL